MEDNRPSHIKHSTVHVGSHTKRMVTFFAWLLTFCCYSFIFKKHNLIHSKCIFLMYQLKASHSDYEYQTKRQTGSLTSHIILLKCIADMILGVPRGREKQPNLFSTTCNIHLVAGPGPHLRIVALLS